ncbi:4428_t:CDS:2 [Funneliformis geosporum]|nr:4428_t:CDS:2 [Funneliformis geosporum]
MGHWQHFLTSYIVVLNKKANKSNKYAMCRACINVLGREETYKNKFTNTKKECIRHFQSCSSFAATYTSKQINELLDKAKKMELNDLSSDEDSDFETDILND